IMPRSRFYRTAAIWLLLGSGLSLGDVRPATALDRAPAWPQINEAAVAPLELPACFAVDYSAREWELFDDLADGRLDRHRLLTAALIAGGLTDREMFSRYEMLFEQFVERRLAERNAAASVEGRAAALLEALHGELLSGGYDRH